MKLDSQRLIGVVALVSALVLAPSARAQETKRNFGSSGASSSGSSGCGGQTSRFTHDEIQQLAEQVHGDQADCYMKLYDAETSSNPACEQQAVPNPPGVGLCTLEGDPTKRRPRGGACDVDNVDLDANTEDGVMNQMKCCAYILETSGSAYFQPVKDGKVPNCAESQSSAVAWLRLGSGR